MDSKHIFELRNQAKSLFGSEKLEVLNEAWEFAKELYEEDPDDEWVQRAFAWVLIDLCKYHLENNNINQAEIHFQELDTIDFNFYDDIIPSQINFLRPKINIVYSEIQKAEELSKSGKHQEVLNIFKTLISQNKLTEIHHENYGWIIYRFIKAEENNLSSVEVRTFLRDYMNLRNERPSLLHSMILNFALNYSKTHTDFKFYNFFLLWNPENLRHEDLYNGKIDGKEIPSLISRICKEFFYSNTEVNLEDLLSKINLKKDEILDFFREPFFWNIFNAHKENKFTDLWRLFEQYNDKYSKYGQSKWHSEILNLAERWMKENEEWRFLHFFKNWKPENFRNEDWKETKKDGFTYKPLAIKSIKKSFEILKNQKEGQDLSWLIQIYQKAVNSFPEDEFLLREKALLHFKNNEADSAIQAYKQLVLDLADKYYIWQEFSDCVSDNSLKIGMLSKALHLEKNEDFLGDIHLNLAQILIDENLLENAKIELEIYKKHREVKSWKLSSFFTELYAKVNSVEQTLKNNQDLYKKYIVIAENFAYADFEWIELVLVDKWKDAKGKERLTFTDGKTIDFAINKNRFEILKTSEIGEIFKFKLHKQEIKKEEEGKYSWSVKNLITEYKYVPLVVEKSDKKHWEILENTFAVVDYINIEKNIIHAITINNEEVFFPQTKNKLQIGDFIIAKKYSKKVKDEDETKIELKNIKKTNKELALSNFKSEVAIVDNVNEQKQLFHFVISSKLQGIVKFSETKLRPKEGNFIKVFYALKRNKDKKIRVKVLDIGLTEEINENLRKSISGELELNYKSDNIFPDFGFVNDYYVPKYLLEKHNITEDCDVKVTVIFTGDKWKTVDIERM